jgi:hypothetical protein
MRLIPILFIGIGVCSGCASQQFWVKEGIDLKRTAAELEDCRLKANEGGQKVFSAQELEGPCMVAKGFKLSTTPPLETNDSKPEKP